MLRKRERIEEDRQEFHWGFMLWFGSRELGNAENITMGRMVMNPGTTNDRHYHTNCEEVLHLVNGRVRHSIDDREIEQEPGDFVSIPPYARHCTTNIGEGKAELIIAFSSGERDFIPVP